MVYEEDKNKLVSLDGSVEIKLFQKIVVQITVDEDTAGSQRSKTRLSLVEPVVPGMREFKKIKTKSKKIKTKV